MVRRTARQGYTLLEVMAVMAALVVLGVIILPTLAGLRGNTSVKAGADTVRSLLAQGRARAIETGQNHKLTITPDGRTVRVQPDSFDPQAEQPVVFTDDLPAGVTIALLDDGAAVSDAGGALRVATLLPDGTCREDSVFLQLTEAGVSPMTLRIRGLTGNVTIAANPTGVSP